MEALLVTFCAGLSVLVGSIIIKFTKNAHKFENLSIAIALGALLSLLIFDLGPEILEMTEEAPILSIILAVIGGFAFLVLLDRFVPDHDGGEHNSEHIGIIASLAVILHNILEGMAVYTLALSSLQKGILFAVGISLHNIPMGMLIYSTLSEHKKSRKIGVLSVVTLSTLVGGILMALVSTYITAVVEAVLMSVATGMILYIVFVELLPHTIKTKPILPSAIGAAAGFVIVLISCLLG